MRVRAFAAAVFLCAATLPDATAADGLQPDAIFARAKTAWRTRSEVAFVRYALRERYDWRGRTHDNWWQAAYRQRDGSLALQRVIVATDERQRLRGAPIALNLRLHHTDARADSLDTNPNADAFPILDPLIEPNASFGLLRRETKAALVASTLTATPSAAPTNTPAPTAAPTDAPLGIATEKPLRELARVEVTARDYTIALSGIERVRGADTYHLTLVPLRDPRTYRLRDLWVDETTFATVQLAMQGLFDGKPYDDARWIVGYVNVEGRNYVQQIRTDDTLRFGLDRVVTDLQYDFVGYEFPASLPETTFQRYL